MDKRPPAAGGIANTTSPSPGVGHSHSQEEMELPRRDARPSASLEKGPRNPSELCVGKMDDESAAEEAREDDNEAVQTPIPAVGRAPGALVTGRWLLNITRSCFQ